MAALALIVPLAASAAGLAPRTVAPAETFTVGMLQVERFGAASGTPIVLIPGLFCGTWVWNREIALLAPAHPVYALTLPGFDGRPAAGGDMLMNRAAADLARLIAVRHLGHPVIVGHSLGGTLAVLFAEKYPTAAAAIISAEGGYPVAPTRAARERAVAAFVQPYVGTNRTTFPPVLKQRMLQYVITDQSDVNAVERLVARADPAAVVAWMRAALTLDLTPGLSAIHVPFTEIVPFDARIDPYVGYKTFAAKHAAYAQFVAHAPHGSVVMIPNARHFEMLDQPAAFDRALLAAVAHA
ncbi:MAG: alpha/beta hydrolase [Candidatus Eremiobacteraeota bacterium]|nr:alpha/beta hydrolase [Candidatus Eremiobacteraeota bacterium]